MTISSSDLQMYMRCLAGVVWEQQKGAFHFGFSLQEETITEMLLLCIAKQLTPLGFKVRIFSRKEESHHGADWEWFYKSRSFKVSFRVQAKRLYHSPHGPGAYKNFKPCGDQLKKLISKAGGANPIYVLYNHPVIKDACLFNWRSYWGCSVATAAFMATASDNKLSTIIHGQVPWHQYFGIGKICLAEKQTASMPGDQEFKWAKDYKPDWIDLLLGNEEHSDERLDEILKEGDLKGVAYFGCD